MSSIEQPWYRNEEKWKEFLVTHKITPANLAGMKEAFCLYDKDRDGFIDSKELAICMRSLGQSPTQAEILDMASEIDADGDGMIDFYEFVMLMSRQMRDVDSKEAIVDAFKIFDLGTLSFAFSIRSNRRINAPTDGDGFITHDELRHMMTGMGEKLTHSEVDEIIKQADQDGDGKINLEEFTRMLLPAHRDMPPLAASLH